MDQYKAVLIGCSRMGAFIDNEVPADMRPYSHAAGYEACERTDLDRLFGLAPRGDGTSRRALRRPRGQAVH